MIVQDIVVSIDHQRRGIGKGLLAKVLSCLKEKGYRRAILTVTKGNEALYLYQRIGFRFYSQYPEIVQNEAL